MIEDSNKQNSKGKKRNNNNWCHRNTEKKKTRIEYYEQIYANKLDNLEEINKFPETYCLPKISQDETVWTNQSLCVK